MEMLDRWEIVELGKDLEGLMVDYEYCGSKTFRGKVISYLGKGEILTKEWTEKFFGTAQHHYNERMNQWRSPLMDKVQTKESEAESYAMGYLRGKMTNKANDRIILLVKGSYRELILNQQNHIVMVVLQI